MNFRFAVLAAFLLISGLVPAHAEEGSRVILVLDASGSMRGKIEGKTKMDIAKEVVAKLVAAWKPEDELGLVAYGHREKGSCEDIEVLREPGALDADSYMDAVNGLNPKGKTPMTAAVRKAAEALQYTEKKATVILVSDGIETCDPNPCAVAEELEKLGVGLTVHTVGFGLDDKGAVAQLKCLAEKTGGTYSTANNAKELQKALAKTVAAPPPAPPPAAVEFNLVGHVVMAEGVELPEKFNQPAWDFHESVGGELGERLTTEYNTNVKINLPHDGDYFAHVKADNAEITVPFKIEKGKATKLELSLDAGIIKFTGYMDDDTELTDDGAAWQLFDATGDGSVTNYGSSTTFLAKAGTRKIALSLGTARVEQEAVFEAGKVAEQKISLGAGIIEASAVYSEGGELVPEGAAVELQKGEVNLDGKHEGIRTDYAAPTIFKAPAGKYLIVVSKDYATGSAPVELKSGALQKVQVNINAGFMNIKAPGATSFVIFSAEKNLAGERKNIGTEYGEELNKAFSAGTYHVVVQGPDNVVLGEKDIEIKAGARSETTVP
jgi:Ca-activated chloride channel family protein